jgi:hypothetical protein
MVKKMGFSALFLQWTASTEQPFHEAGARGALLCAEPEEPYRASQAISMPTNEGENA